MVQIFETIGFGQWFRYLTGAVELAGAVLLVIPRAGFYGGLLLTATMVGPVAVHLSLIEGSAAPALVLGLLSAFVAWSQRPTAPPSSAS